MNLSLGNSVLLGRKRFKALYLAAAAGIVITVGTVVAASPWQSGSSSANAGAHQSVPSVAQFERVRVINYSPNTEAEAITTAEEYFLRGVDVRLVPVGSSQEEASAVTTMQERLLVALQTGTDAYMGDWEKR